LSYDDVLLIEQRRIMRCGSDSLRITPHTLYTLKL
jgi:hypothetical protein